jgi:hypothetical protein
MSRKKDFDPQAIPNFGGAGRMGEMDPNEPEEQQSSAQIQGTDPDIQTDPAAGVESPEPAPENPRTPRDDRARGETHVHSDNPEPPTAGRGRPDTPGTPS